MPDDLARRQTIRDLVTAYQDAVEKFQSAYTLIADGEERLNAAFNLAQTDHHAITLRGRRDGLVLRAAQCLAGAR